MATNMITIDAAGRTLGRVASEAAIHLRGKSSPSFERHEVPKTRVTVINVNGLRIDPKKQLQKTYRHYTGYPGGLKEATLKVVIEKKGMREALLTAITRMIPRTKLRPEIMKHLTLTN